MDSVVLEITYERHYSPILVLSMPPHLSINQMFNFELLKTLSLNDSPLDFKFLLSSFLDANKYIYTCPIRHALQHMPSLTSFPRHWHLRNGESHVTDGELKRSIAQDTHSKRFDEASRHRQSYSIGD